jgi:hypothetical protein
MLKDFCRNLKAIIMFSEIFVILISMLSVSNVQSQLSAGQLAEQTLINTLLTGYNPIIKPDVSSLKIVLKKNEKKIKY